MTLAVDGKICTHIETGLAHDIADGKVSDTPTRENYFTAGALKENQVDYVMNNVGFSSTSDLYSLPLRDDVRERAEKTLAEREQALPLSGNAPPPRKRPGQNEKSRIGGWMMVHFTVEEENLVCVYYKADRHRTMGHMTAADFEDACFLFTDD